MSDIIQELEKLISEWKDSPYQDFDQDAIRCCAEELQTVLNNTIKNVYKNAKD